MKPKTLIVSAVPAIAILTTLGLYGCGNQQGPKPASAPAASRAEAPTQLPNTSVISLVRLEGDRQVLRTNDACESLSNVLIPESSTFSVSTSEGTTRFVSEKPNCATQAEGYCQCACPTGTGFTLLRTLEPKVAGSVPNYVETVFCSPATR